jgi:MFS transporter, PAT family, beta-lactamase induction signal transducer AmpG
VPARARVYAARTRSPAPDPAALTPFLRQLGRVLAAPRLWLALLMGFASGLPLLALGSTLQARLLDSGIDLAAVGAISLVGLPYTWKFLWSPSLDRYVPPILGRRRGWLAASQACLALAFVWLAVIDPSRSPWLVGAAALIAALFSATQDIAIDAYRRESLRDEELGLGSSLYVIGYRVGMLTSGAGALALADRIDWRLVYLVLAGFAAAGLVLTLVAREPPLTVPPPRTIRAAVVEPFLEFFRRNGARHAVLLLSFVLLYKIGDAMASNMLTPFILTLGYSKATLAAIGKVFGLVSLLFGGFVGGALVLRWGMVRALFVFGVLQAVSTAAFPVLQLYAGAAPDVARGALAAVIAFENMTSGMGSAAFVGFMASLTNRKFTATQYALLTSLMAVPRVVLSAPTGWMVEQIGWTSFFLFCAAIAIPGLALISWIASPAPSAVVAAPAAEK